MNRSIILLIICLLTFVLITSVMAGPDDEPEQRIILMALYNGTDGSNWHNNEGWGSEAWYCSWWGVDCTNQSYVRGLFLDGNNLSGSFPTELRNLSELEYLILNNNNLSGSIPTELSYLDLLIDLKLSDNPELTCWETFTALLWAAGLPFYEGPNTVCGLELVRMWLPIAANQMEGAENDDPDQRTALMALFESTDGYHWSVYHGWGSEHSYCTWFGVTCNESHDVVQIDLNANGLDGVIPPGLGSLRKLERLHLNDNVNCATYTCWDGLHGSIPSDLNQLTNLQELHLDNNFLHGWIPRSLAWLGNLDSLDLSDNRLDGSIPLELGILSNLHTLKLANNQFSGMIPVELGNLSNLQELYLNGNVLTGSIPPNLGNLNKLRKLRLDHNDLSGAIPPEIGDLSNLQWFAIEHNRLSGPMPPELGNLGNLMLFVGGNNYFGTPIPPELGNLSNLRNFHFPNSALTGTIPQELGDMNNLVTLYLEGNNLSNPIPSTLLNLQNLTELALVLNPNLNCWESEEARDWAIALPYFEGPTAVCESVSVNGFGSFLLERDEMAQ